LLYQNNYNKTKFLIKLLFFFSIAYVSSNMALLYWILDTVQCLMSNIKITSSSVFDKLRQIIYMDDCISIKKQQANKKDLNKYLYIIFDRKSFIGNIVSPRILVIFYWNNQRKFSCRCCFWCIDDIRSFFFLLYSTKKKHRNKREEAIDRERKCVFDFLFALYQRPLTNHIDWRFFFFSLSLLSTVCW
jgi:hypothetical protein